MFSRLKAYFKPKLSPFDENQASDSKKSPERSGWIGVDLDGTLAEYTKWRGIQQIGAPVPLMLKRVNAWLQDGYTVKIMTARASVPEGVEPVQKWLAKHGLPGLEVTNQKDFQMIELWDDRAIQVVVNEGKPILRTSHFSRPKAPLLPDEDNGETCEVTRKQS